MDLRSGPPEAWFFCGSEWSPVGAWSRAGDVTEWRVFAGCHCAVVRGLR